MFLDRALSPVHFVQHTMGLCIPMGDVATNRVAQHIHHGSRSIPQPIECNAKGKDRTIFHTNHADSLKDGSKKKPQHPHRESAMLRKTLMSTLPQPRPTGRTLE